MSAKHVCVLDCQSEFNCCLFGLNIISSGSRATVVLQNKTKWDTQVFTHLFRTAIKCAIIAAFCIRAVFHQSPPPTRLITHLFPSSPCLFFYFFFFFYSKAADERSRWFVLWLVSAPLSPLSDHLHLLPSIQRHSAVESRVCVRWTATHAKDWQCAKYAASEVPIKTNLRVMKQLRAVVKVSRRSSWPK